VALAFLFAGIENPDNNKNKKLPKNVIDRMKIDDLFIYVNIYIYECNIIKKFLCRINKKVSNFAFHKKWWM